MQGVNNLERSAAAPTRRVGVLSAHVDDNAVRYIDTSLFYM